MDTQTFEQETVILYREPCNCGDRVQHNNGGNYHRVVKLHTFVSGEHWAVVIENTDTREAFPRDEYESLMHDTAVFLKGDGTLVLEPSDRIDGEMLEQEIARFRYGEAEILAQG